MKRIITVQHTQSVHHTNGMVGSWTDWELSELGKKQADNIGKKLCKEFDKMSFVMYSSDLTRAKQTAEIIGGHMNITPIFKNALRERNLGKCVGKSVKWLRENMECEEKTIDDRMFSYAESRRDEWNRLAPFFNYLLACNDENIIIVSHGDLLGVFNAMWVGLDVDILNSFEMTGSAGGVSHFILSDNGKRFIRRFSDLSYILD